MRALALSAALAAARAASPFTLHLLDSPTYPLARCLDGSPPGFYFAPGSGSGSRNWVIHTQGGGWCGSDADCASRASSALGSSRGWAATGCDASTASSAPVCYADGGFNGMISNSSDVNPQLYNWNKVFVAYCDGGSYAGARTAPVTVGSQTIYYRGRYNLDGVYAELFKLGLGSADTVVVKGCSAGGLAVFLHLDYIAAKIRAVSPSTRVVGAPGAGFFLGEAKPFTGGGYLSVYQWVFDAHNVSGVVDGFSSTNDACLAARAVSNDTWKCFIAPEVLPYIATPLFVSNSLTDAWQAGAVMGLGCSPAKPGGCPAAAVAYLSDFRQQMLDLLEPIMAPGSPHGGFLQGCFVHVVEDVGGWGQVRVGGQTQAQTFASWLAGGDGAKLEIDTFPPWSNPTC